MSTKTTTDQLATELYNLIQPTIQPTIDKMQAEYEASVEAYGGSGDDVTDPDNDAVVFMEAHTYDIDSVLASVNEVLRSSQHAAAARVRSVLGEAPFVELGFDGNDVWVSSYGGDFADHFFLTRFPVSHMQIQGLSQAGPQTGSPDEFSLWLADTHLPALAADVASRDADDRPRPHTTTEEGNPHDD